MNINPNNNSNIPLNSSNQIQSSISPVVTEQNQQAAQNSQHITSSWAKEDDEKLIKLRNEGLSFDKIAQHLPGKSSTTCADHWRNVIEPQLLGKQITWTIEEKNKLTELVLPIFKAKKKIKWKLISEQITSKTARQCSKKWSRIKSTFEQEDLSDAKKTKRSERDLTHDDSTSDEPVTKRRKLDLNHDDCNPDTKIDESSTNSTPVNSETYLNSLTPSNNEPTDTSSNTTTTTTTNPNWSELDDAAFIKLKNDGCSDREITKHFPGKSLKDCIHHWKNTLEPRLFRESLTWTAEEKNQLSKLVSRFVSDKQEINWKLISRRMPSKTPSQCYNQWHFSRRALQQENLSKEPSLKQSKIDLTHADSNFDSEMGESPVDTSSLFNETHSTSSFTQNNPTASSSSTTTTTTTTSDYKSSTSETSTTSRTADLFDNTINKSPTSSPKGTNSNKKSANYRRKPWDPKLKQDFTNRIHELLNLNKKIDWKVIGSEFTEKGSEKCRNMWRNRIEPKLQKEYEAMPAWNPATEAKLLDLVSRLNKNWILIAEEFTNISPTECRLYFTYKLGDQKPSQTNAQSRPFQSTPNSSSQSHFPPPRNWTSATLNAQIPSVNPFIHTQNNLFPNTGSTNPTWNVTTSPTATNPPSSNPLKGLTEVSMLKSKLMNLENLVLNFRKLPLEIFNPFQQNLQYYLQQENQQYDILKVIIESGRGSNLEIKMIETHIQQIERSSMIYTTILNHYNLYNCNTAFAEGPTLYKNRTSTFFNLYNSLLFGSIPSAIFQLEMNRIYAEDQYQILKASYVQQCLNLNSYSRFFSPQYQLCLNELVSNYPVFMNNQNTLFILQRTQGEIFLLNQIASQLSKSIKLNCLSDIETVLIQCLKKQTGLNELTLAIDKIEINELKIEFLKLANEDTNQELTLSRLRQFFKQNILKFHPDKGGDAEIAGRLTELRKKIEEVVSRLPQTGSEIKF